MRVGCANSIPGPGQDAGSIGFAGENRLCAPHRRGSLLPLPATVDLPRSDGVVDIGEPERTYTVEPLEDPVPRELPESPTEAPEREPPEPEKVESA
jgi:hypothetical protein